MSSYSEALEFFNRMTGKTADQINISDLSSAQRARFVSWCSEQCLSIESLENGAEVPVTQVKANIPIVTTARSNSVFGAGSSGVGVDIQDISELFPEDLGDFKSNDRLLKIFTSKEISYAEMKKNPEDTLAGIFSAKEAVFKASKLSHLESWSDIEICHSDEGVPFHNEFSISISHNKGMAVAVAVSPQLGGSPIPDPNGDLKQRIDDLERKLAQALTLEKPTPKERGKTLLMIAASVVISSCFSIVLYNQVLPNW